MNDINTNKSINSLNVDTQRTPVELLSIVGKSTKSVTIDTSFKSVEGINIVELRNILNQLNDKALSSALFYDFLQAKTNDEMNWDHNITAF
ncbi:hypothetical protein [Colwellia piezophila]|uniref:hypothetical protein n=1 Tax=Colwellia piezophila TaxID=211668 RepID=UPI00037E7F4E|nr:hypothetical protein [Colwellia piezophila]